MVEHLQPCEYIKEGGSGNKAVSVIEGKVDAFIYPRRGM